jgi:hypothetical protein
VTVAVIGTGTIAWRDFYSLRDRRDQRLTGDFSLACKLLQINSTLTLIKAFRNGRKSIAN